MKKFIYLLIISVFLICSCATNEVQEEIQDELPVQEESQAQADEAVPEEEPAIQLVMEEEPDIVVISEPEEPVNEEYLRSISSLSGEEAVIVPPKVFEDDKSQIFVVINALDTAMKKKDFNTWVSYLTPYSYEYWSNRHNLHEISLMLFPLGDRQLNNIREYFEQFFIPARRGRLVDEIRYVTPDYVKVVQYKNNTDIIYYFFEKIDGEWKLSLDTL